MDLYEITSNGLFAGLDELLPVSATGKHQDQDYLTFFLRRERNLF